MLTRRGALLAGAIAGALCLGALLVLRLPRSDGGGPNGAVAEPSTARAPFPLEAESRPATNAHARVAVATSSAPTARPSPNDVLILAGRVVDRSARPVARAHVAASTRLECSYNMLDLALPREGARFGVTDTDDAGRFTFSVRRATPLELVVVAAGFARQVVADCYGGQELEIVLDAGARVHGRVVAAKDKSPIHGAEVRAFAPGRRGDLARTPTAPGGGYLLADLPPGKLYVEVVPPLGELPGWVTLEPRAGESIEHDFVIAEGEITRGRITDATTGAPIERAEIGIGWTLRRPTRSDESGHYEISGYPQSNGEALFARAEGYGNASQVLTKSAPTRVLDFVLTPGASAKGRVLDDAGRPIRGAYVAAVATESSGPTQRADWRASSTAADGTFVCRGLQVGLRHALYLRVPGTATLVHDFPRAVRAGETLDLGDFVTRPAGSLEGRIVDPQGRPVALCEISLTGTNADRARLAPGAVGAGTAPGGHYVSERRARSGGDGRFWFAELATGEYGLWIGSLSGANRNLERIAVTGGETLALGDLVLERGLAIRGVVVAPSGDRIMGVAVRAEPGGARTTASASTGRDGTFVLDGLVPGKHTISAMALGTSDSSGTPLADAILPGVTAGQSDLRIVLAPAALVEGKVVGANGAPLSGIRVSFQIERPAPATHLLTATSDAQGAFRIVVPAGSSGRLKLLDEPGAVASFPHGFDPRKLPPVKSVAAGSSGHVLEVK